MRSARKTYDNILRDFSDMQILHQKEISEIKKYLKLGLFCE